MQYPTSISNDHRHTFSAVSATVALLAATFINLPLAHAQVPGASVPESTPPESTPPESTPPTPEPDGFTDRPSVMMGIGQWALFAGGNIAAQYKTGRWAFEYSHGQALDLAAVGDFALTAEERDAGVSLRMPWTTGAGVGFNITPNLHVLVEFKAHRYELTGIDPRETIAYTTLSVGPGVFYDIYIYKGLFLQPNLRFWPNVHSSLKSGASVTAADGSRYQHESHNLGVFANANLGWTFSGI